MCRYAFKDYKSHFACFDCRKTFKKTSITDWTKQKGLDYAYKKLLRDWATKNRKRTEEEVGTTYEKIRDIYLEDVATCPQCGGTMAAMGLDFKAPKNAATEEWEVLRVLYDHGFAFHGCGCSVGYAPPKKISGLSEFFREHGRISEGERLLARTKQAKA
jgi:hypothetical protein